jgi:hypothetical protein
VTAPAPAPAVVPWSPRPRRTAWLDYHTGAGVDDTGTVITAPGAAPRDGGGRHPRELLELARAHAVERIYLTGPRPGPGWLFTPTPGWSPGAHFLDADLPVGRFTHAATGARVDLRRAAEWFGESADPAAALGAHRLLGALYARTVPGGRLFDSPGATGLDAWVRSHPRGQAPPGQLPGDLAELVRSTSPQHRVELFAHPGDTLPGLWYLDGRLQYAALTAGLGAAPGEYLDGAPARAAWESPQGRYARNRWLVKFAVPHGWDTLGVLMVPRGPGGCGPLCCPRTVPGAGAGWHAPHAPGWVGTTWCDGAELALAAGLGWPVRVTAAVRLTPARPLDAWTARLTRALAGATPGQLGTLAAPVSPARAAMVRGAFRAMLLHGIGSFHSTGREVTRVVTDPMAYTGAAPLVGPVAPGVWVAHERATLSGRAAALAHPEFSAQVWGRAHARILESPTGQLARAGALQVHPDTLVGIRGDAIYLTADPGWPDDGAPGRLRLKGHLHGPVPTPRTGHELNVLRDAAERNGATCPRCPMRGNVR